MHYEGIEGFATDYPCRIEVKGDVFEIRRIKPETTVTLPMNRIKSFSALEEKNLPGQQESQESTSITWLWNMTKGCLLFGELQKNINSSLHFNMQPIRQHLHTLNYN